MPASNEAEEILNRLLDRFPEVSEFVMDFMQELNLVGASRQDLEDFFTRKNSQ